jgi:hypothetical protein
MAYAVVRVLNVTVERQLPASTLYKIVVSCGCRWWHECAESERPLALGDRASCYATHYLRSRNDSFTGIAVDRASSASPIAAKKNARITGLHGFEKRGAANPRRESESPHGLQP